MTLYNHANILQYISSKCESIYLTFVELHGCLVIFGLCMIYVYFNKIERLKIFCSICKPRALNGLKYLIMHAGFVNHACSIDNVNWHCKSCALFCNDDWNELSNKQLLHFTLFILAGRLLPVQTRTICSGLWNHVLILATGKLP